MDKANEINQLISVVIALYGIIALCLFTLPVNILHRKNSDIVDNNIEKILD